MKIAVDCDGVVYEWHRSVRYMLRAYRGVTMPPIAEWNEWDAPYKMMSPADRDWLWKEGVELGLFRYGHIATGAIVGLRGLLSAGHSLSVVTHRPTQAVPDTLAWLSYLNIPWSEIHILSNEEPKATIDADLLIDDKLENCNEWVASGRIALLYDRPWNQNQLYLTRVIRCYDWEGVGLNVGHIQSIGARRSTKDFFGDAVVSYEGRWKEEGQWC